MRRTLGFLCLLAILVTASAAAHTEDPSAAPKATAAPAIADLAWLAGHWMRIEAGTRMEEGWFGPAGGMMLGLHRDVMPSGKSAFEFLRIAETEEGIVYFASPGGRPATGFPLTALEERQAVFENPEHDFPQRIIYRREGSVLHARVEGLVDGKQESEEWTWDLQP